jgi:hypothetical protein
LVIIIELSETRLASVSGFSIITGNYKYRFFVSPEGVGDFAKVFAEHGVAPDVIFDGYAFFTFRICRTSR